MAWAIARQVTPLGFNWIHSPVLDVNTAPLNPEIGTRSYGENPQEVITFASAAMKGLKSGGLIATGKHFPGRGESVSDAHRGLPVISLSRKELEEHLRPFRALIDAGIPSIMSAHTAYPALDPSGVPSSLSKIIITDLLKGEMGFKGSVTTDDITMGGIIENFEAADACIRAINAGNDLVLFRDESSLIDEVYPLLVEAAKSGVIAEERLNDALSRTLSVKYDYGMFDNKGIMEEEKAGDGILDKKVKALAVEAANKVVRVLRDDAKLLPLSKDKSVLLIEQVNPLHKMTNSQECHPCILWENLLKHSDKVAMVETNLEFSDDDKERVKRRMNECDVIIITNYYYRQKGGSGNSFVKQLHELCGKPVIVVTNSPYPFSVSPDFKTVVVTYGASPEIMSRIAELIFS